MKKIQKENGNFLGEVRLTYYRNPEPKMEAFQLLGSHSVRDFILTIPEFKEQIEHREMVYVLLLNKANCVIGYYLVGLGGLDSCICDLKIIFQVAILSNAASIILVHNHPSGSLTISQGDENITRKLRDGCALMDLQLLDSLIINPDFEYRGILDDIS